MNTPIQPKQAYVAKHIPGDNSFNASLKTIKSENKKRIIVPAYEINDSTGQKNPTIEAPAEVYKLQSVLFNNSIVIKQGTVSLNQKYIDRINKIEKLFIFLRRFENRDIQGFISVFENAITCFTGDSKSEDVYDNFRPLHELQELVRIIISLGDEPGKITEDLLRISHAYQFGIKIDKQVL